MGNRNTQDLLLDVATELFYRKGYSGTSIREVGIKAKMSNSLLYHYFKNKEEMLFQIISGTSIDLIKALEMIEEQVDDPFECLTGMLYEHVVGFALKRRKESKIVVEEHHWLTGKRKEAIAAYERRIYDLYYKKLEALARAGLIRDIDLTVLNFSIFGMVNWFYKWYREGGKLSPQVIAENIVMLLFHGMMERRDPDPGQGGSQ